MNPKGFSLVELMVVLALIGITSTIAAVSLSSNDAALRSFARDFRFSLEKAKQEALARSLPVGVAFYDPGPIDCNADGQVNDRDRCYVVYAEQDGLEGFNPAQDLTLARGVIPSSLILANTTDLLFSPFGGSRAADLEMETAFRTDYHQCASQCMTVSYPIRVNHVGRIEIGEKEETCADCSLCESCP
jgi:prepilin-type N-terminal cleavage/methylation domain-containing protein